MNLYPIWKDYLELTKISVEDKEGQGLRRTALLAWEKRPYASLPSLSETIRFVRFHPVIPYVPPFWGRLVFPGINPRLDDAAAALRLLFEQDMIEAYREFVHRRFSIQRLEEIVLARYPADPAVLRNRYDRLTRRLAYTVQNVPHYVQAPDNVRDLSAVRRNIRPAGTRQTAALIAHLPAYKALSEQLGIDNREFLSSLQNLYTAWAAYLHQPESARDFADYLHKRNVWY